MPNITIGGVTPVCNPGSFPLIRPSKPSAKVATWGGVAYFGWPALVAGNEYTLPWDYMEAADFDSLDALYAADEEVQFDLNDGSGKSYMIQITALDGEYHLFTSSGAGVFRKNVRMTILIMSEVA